MTTPANKACTCSPDCINHQTRAVYDTIYDQAVDDIIFSVSGDKKDPISNCHKAIYDKIYEQAVKDIIAKLRAEFPQLNEKKK